MVMLFWEQVETAAMKILKADIKHQEELGQGSVAMKKKRHLEILKHNMELSKAKRDKTKRRHIADAEI